jgi:hypothetical protein
VSVCVCVSYLSYLSVAPGRAPTLHSATPTVVPWSPISSNKWHILFLGGALIGSVSVLPLEVSSILSFTPTHGLCAVHDEKACVVVFHPLRKLVDNLDKGLWYGLCQQYVDLDTFSLLWHFFLHFEQS